MKKPNATARTRREKALRPREMPQEWRKEKERRSYGNMLVDRGGLGRTRKSFFLFHKFRPTLPAGQ